MFFKWNQFFGKTIIIYLVIDISFENRNTCLKSIFIILLYKTNKSNKKKIKIINYYLIINYL
jgi:hypothetical protein